MSRSSKKTPVFGNAGSNSEQWDKRQYNRKARRANKQVLALLEGDLEEVAPISEVLESDLLTVRDVSDTWNMAKDGKFWSSEPSPKAMRK